MEILLRHTAQVIIKQSIKVRSCSVLLSSLQLNDRMICSRCQVLQGMQFHTATPCFVAKVKNTKKKLVSTYCICYFVAHNIHVINKDSVLIDSTYATR